jgi:hypothetical protein
LAKATISFFVKPREHHVPALDQAQLADSWSSACNSRVHTPTFSCSTCANFLMDKLSYKISSSLHYVLVNQLAGPNIHQLIYSIIYFYYYIILYYIILYYIILYTLKKH